MTRTDKTTWVATQLTLEEAETQFITDNFNYALQTTDAEEVGELEDWLMDMTTVFEALSILKALAEGDEADAGVATYRI